jgi:hypothetical protein
LSNNEPSPTRRLVLGGSIATVGGASALVTADPAAATGGPSSSSTGVAAAAPGAPGQVLPALAAGEKSVYYGPLGWTSYSFSAGASVVIGGGYGSRASSGWLGRGVDLEPGSVITGMDFTLQGSGSVSGSAFLMRSTPDTAGAWTIQASVSGVAVGTTSATVNQPVTATNAFSLEVATGATSYVAGVRLRYRPPAPSGLNFVAVTPARVYDSRYNMAPDANGAISTGANRTISVANGRSTSTGAVTIPNVVPSTAKAIAYTLTVTQTTASGYLAVNPGGDAVVHASSINWLAGQSLANTGVIGISPTRTITVICGNGTTQFIIDVIGYYVS